MLTSLTTPEISSSKIGYPSAFCSSTTIPAHYPHPIDWPVYCDMCCNLTENEEYTYVEKRHPLKTLGDTVTNLKEINENKRMLQRKKLSNNSDKVATKGWSSITSLAMQKRGKSYHHVEQWREGRHLSIREGGMQPYNNTSCPKTHLPEHEDEWTLLQGYLLYIRGGHRNCNRFVHGDTPWTGNRIQSHTKAKFPLSLAVEIANQ